MIRIAFVAAGLFALAFPSGSVAENSSAHERPPLPPVEVIAGLPPDGGAEFNRLIFEKSPYLLQHARNPINWFPWGEAAFEKARNEDKPIFLSIGYSTCHWCHVMERESFEDEEVAALLNDDFVAIKVDREERPDLDQIYMSVTQAMTGHGGWPMTIVMRPDRMPFFAGTYFPKRGRGGRPGMMELLPALAEAWRSDRDQIDGNVEQILDFLRRSGAEPSNGSLTEDHLKSAYAQFEVRYDATHGGFGRAPKFPSPHNLLFLLRYAHRTGNDHALDMVTSTLTAMRRGGIFDHVGFGFHRYSTDEQWLLPHFEKMLYDQAMMTLAYTEAYQATRNPLFARTVREILTYVQRDMTSPEGGFYSAEDADSEGEEGRFYLWTPEEVRDVLGEEEADRWMQVHGFEDGGNFLEESSREKSGRNIPHRDRSDREWGQELGLSDEAWSAWLERSRHQLFEAREARVHPLKDDKILTDWNGLMIAAFSRAARVLDEEAFAVAATRAADFALEHLRSDDGRLHKRYRHGEAGLQAHLDDYAFLIWGLTELYETTFETRYLEAALQLQAIVNERFPDEAGGFFFSEASDELIVRPKEVFDGAIPSGHSVTALNLIRLSRMTGNTGFEEQADELFGSVSGYFPDAAAGFGFLLNALDFSVGPGYEIVVSGAKDAEDTRAMLAALHSRYSPNKVVLLRPDGDNPPIARLAPFTKAQRPLRGRATAYVCQNFACNTPTTDIDEMMQNLNPS